MDTAIYGRLTTKQGYKLLRDTQTLLSAPGEEGELVPAFDATFAFDNLTALSPDKKKILHKLLGGSGEADRLCLFTTTHEPVVKDIPLRRSQEVKKLAGVTFKEVKFKSGTPVALLGCY